MKTLHELAIEYAKSIYQEEYDDPTFAPDVYQSKNDFAAGYKAAFEWISVDDELPENETYINLKLKNGDLGARFYENIDKDMLLRTCSHWRPINND